MLQIGKPAPKFTLPDADMEMVHLTDFKGKNVVICFYPKDNTPGCTLQAIEFSDMDDQFARLGAVVLGINRDDCMSHADFRDKHGLAMRLLADTDLATCEKYGVWQEREVDGKKRMGIVRTTFIVDGHGVLRHILHPANSKGHAAEVLALIRQMGQS